MRMIEEIEADIRANHMRECTDDQPELWEEICDKYDELRLEYYKTLTTGIDFERLEEICQAERENRCVVLPCKMGDELWFVVTKYRGKKSEYSFVKGGWLCESNFFSVLNNFGKTVFLTREEAENALKGEGDE